MVPGRVRGRGVRQALWLSVQAAFLATLVAMVLGTLLSLGVSRYSFFGRETVSFIVILPIALPGIITGSRSRRRSRTSASRSGC